jgi:hypothetical protein
MSKYSHVEDITFYWLFILSRVYVKICYDSMAAATLTRGSDVVLEVFGIVGDDKIPKI